MFKAANFPSYSVVEIDGDETDSGKNHMEPVVQSSTCDIVEHSEPFNPVQEPRRSSRRCAPIDRYVAEPACGLIRQRRL